MPTPNVSHEADSIATLEPTKDKCEELSRMQQAHNERIGVHTTGMS